MAREARAPLFPTVSVPQSIS